MDVGQLEVVQPASHQAVEPPDSFGKTYGNGFAGQLFKLSLKGFPALRTHHQLVLAFDPLFEYWDKMIAQYVECRGAANPAFLPVNGQAKHIPEKQVDAVTYPSGGLFAAHVDAEIVGVPHIAMSAFFQLPVKLVEQNVGQQRT